MSDFFACRKFDLVAIDERCKQHTFRTQDFLIRSVIRALERHALIIYTFMAQD